MPRHLTQQEIELINTSRAERGEAPYVHPTKRFPRSIYVTDEVWEGLRVLAERAGNRQKSGAPNISEFIEEFVRKSL